MSVRGGPNTLGPASHLKQTDPIASQGVGDAGAGRRRDGVFVIQESQPPCQASAWSPSSDHIEVCASVVLGAVFAGAPETAGGIAVSFALASIMLPVAFAQLVIMIRIGGFCPAALFVVGKAGGGNFRDHSEAGQRFGLVLGIGFGHDVGAVAGAGTKTDKGVGHCRILHSLPEHRPNGKGFVRVCLRCDAADCQFLSVWVKIFTSDAQRAVKSYFTHVFFSRLATSLEALVGHFPDPFGASGAGRTAPLVIGSRIAFPQSRFVWGSAPPDRGLPTPPCRGC